MKLYLNHIGIQTNSIDVARKLFEWLGFNFLRIADGEWGVAIFLQNQVGVHVQITEPSDISEWEKKIHGENHIAFSVASPETSAHNLLRYATQELGYPSTHFEVVGEEKFLILVPFLDAAMEFVPPGS